MANYYESEILPITGSDNETKKGKIKKTKMKCCSCGHIDYRLTCPKCGSGMYKNKNKL